MRKNIARAMAAALTLASTSPREALAAARSLEGRAVPRAISLAIALPPVSMAPSPALPRLTAAARTAPALADPQAMPAALKAQAGRDFDASASMQTRADQAVEVPASPAAAAVALSAPAGRRARSAKAVPSPSRARRAAALARSWLPKVAGIAGAAAIGWIANAAGHPELAAAAMPLLMVGMIREQAGSSDADFFDKVLGAHIPGQLLGPADIVELGRQAGLDQDQAFAAVGRLARRGHFALTSNSQALLLDLSVEPADPAMRAALRSAHEALPLLNGDIPEERLQYLSAIYGVYRQYASAMDKRSDNSEIAASQRRQIAALGVHASLEVLRDILADFEDSLNIKTMPPEEYQRGKHAAKILNEYLSSVTVDADNPPARATPEVHALLSALVSRFDVENFKAKREFLLIQRGHKRAQAFLKFLAPQDPAAAKLADDVADYLSAYIPAGAAITAGVQAHMGETIGVGQPQIHEALQSLALEGRVASLNGGKFYIATLAAARARQSLPDGRLRAADEAVLASVKRLGRGGLSQSAQAVNALNQALRDYRAAGIADRAHEDVGQLYANALLALLGETLRLYLNRAPADREPVERVIAWLGDQHLSLDSRTDMLNEKPRQMILGILDSLTGVNSSQRREAREIGRALPLLRRFIADPADHLKTLRPDGEIAVSQKPRALLPAPRGAKRPFQVLENGDSFKTLYTYGVNITAQAAQGKLKPLIGRQKELRQIFKTLLRSEKNNPVVIGEAGVGKTALIEGLAQLIASGDVPPELRDKNIFQLSLTQLIAGTTLRGQFEERVQKVLNEVAASQGRVILFIDEIHKVLGAGGATGAEDLSQMLLESLGHNGLSVIGATTLDKYRKIKADGALNRRLNGIMLSTPSPEEAVAIVLGLRSRYEKKHGVTIPDETVKAAVSYAARYVDDRHLPDSALDLLDDAATEVQLQRGEAPEGAAARTVVASEDIAREIALRMGIPVHSVTADDRAKLISLPERLNSWVVGQHEAVKALVGAVRKSRQGYKDPKQPDAFLFLGPTGVGKTELAKAIAKEVYDSESAMTVFDMSEFMEKHSVSRLVGSPPGYTGYEAGGELTEAVRRRPHQVLLLDEIDKAHPDVLNILLQAIEEGRLTDTHGLVANFKNVMLIMTANFLGAHSRESGPKTAAIGFDRKESSPAGANAAAMRARYIADLKTKVRPEFVNRVGLSRVIVFNELASEHLDVIVKIKMAALNLRLAEKGLAVELTAAAAAHLVADASLPHNRIYGGRPLKQAIDEQLLEALSEAELAGQIGKGDRVTADYDSVAQKWVISRAPML